MKGYFRLADDCFLVEGVKDAAVYDVGRRRVLLLDEPLRQCLRACEDNRPIDPSWCDEAAGRLLGVLAAEGLGAFDDEPAFVDKFRTRAPVRFIGSVFDPARFYRLSWSITNQCDRACGFCPRTPGGLLWKGCMTCVRRGDEPDPPWPVDAVGRTVDQIAGLGVRMLHVRGGNPLLRLDVLRAVVSAARRHRTLTVIVTTPGTGCAPADVVALAEHGSVRVNLVIVPEPEGRPGARSATDARRELTAALVKARVPVTFTHLRAGAAGEDAAPVSPAAAAGHTVAVAGIRTATELAAGGRLDEDPAGKRLTRWSSPDEFYARIGYSVCGVGHCDIACDGTVYPCAGIDEPCGSAASGLGEGLSGPALYERWWRNSKDEIEPCRRCALRYACVDCAAAATARSDGVRRCCAFDPEGTVRAHEAGWVGPDFVYRVRDLLARQGIEPVR